ncbi:Putative Fe-S protein assembly co-chaperone HscB [Rhizopus microsporus]|nr:Putative Fe-S protein assembly co-chaperone HscB [Rhizopus microsporus]CEJ03327.1 Putative Fe-S protein assembly co-chaperone HscB [Rhizopus microsporus]
MSQDKTCWQCQATNKPTALFCENKVCNVIQPIPPELNFFHLFEAGNGDTKQEPTFDIDLKALRRRFLLLQQKAHPDSYSNSHKREHEYAQLQSSVINKAYNTLKNPLTRAKYILQQQGQKIEEHDSLENPELLMEVMELREELEEASSKEELEAIKQKNDEKYKETVQKLKDAFDKKDYMHAKELTIELQYWASIQKAIHDK